MTPTELLALADELEAADVGTRELGDRVLLAFGWHVGPGPGRRGKKQRWWLLTSQAAFREGDQPNPALNLHDWKQSCLPEGAKWELRGPSHGSPRGTLYMATIRGKGRASGGNWVEKHYGADAATPELAACAASVQAMAAMMEAKDVA